MNNGYFFLYLEGMDLSGKSSVSKIIKEKYPLNWKINNNRLTDNNEIYNFIAELAKKGLYNDEIYGYLYYVALMGDLANFKQEANIIQDSTLLLRSINYHMTMGNTKLVELFEKLIDRHPKPDASIYLTASIDARIDRLKKRYRENPEKISKNDELILNNPDRFVEMDRRLLLLAKKYFQAIEFDTSKLTEEEVADNIIHFLKNDCLKPEDIYKTRIKKGVLKNGRIIRIN